MVRPSGIVFRFSNRLPRGRTYVRNGSVVHLEIAEGRVEAYVAGSELYKIKIEIAPLTASDWKQIKAKCAGEIASLVELLQGKLSKNTLALITHRETGLFPKPKEIKLDCSCPDWAVMCKHVSAVLYGVGARLDTAPELFFKLRGVDHLELIETSMQIPRGKMDGETLDASNLGDIFGVELSDGLEGDSLITPPTKTVADGDAERKLARAAKKAAKRPVKKITRKAAKRAAQKKVAKKVAKGKVVVKRAKKKA